MPKKDNRLMSALAVFLLVAVLAGCQKMGRVDQGRAIEFDKEKGTVTMIRDASPNPDNPEYSHLPPVTYQVPTNPDEMGADPKPGKRMKLDAIRREIVIYVPALNNFAKINYTLVDQKENVGPDDPLVLDKVTRKPKTFPVVDQHRKTIDECDQNGYFQEVGHRRSKGEQRGSIRMNLRQKIAVVVVDILVLVELCISIYFANLDADNFTPVFLKAFLGMLIPTLIAAKLVIRKVRSGEPEAQQT